MHQCHLHVRDLGRMAYREAFELQKRLHAEVVASRAVGAPAMHVLLLEHDPPVITLSRRGTTARHLVASPALLARSGVEVCETDRGGDITYHGPGQLVVYPILDLEALGLRLHGYMALLERVVIDTLGRFGVRGWVDPAARGVWVGESPGRKICAMGVRIARWVSMHGLALNVTADLGHFDLIVPCGLSGRTITSLERELGAGCPDMGQVKDALLQTLRAALAPVVAA